VSITPNDVQRDPRTNLPISPPAASNVVPLRVQQFNRAEAALEAWGADSNLFHQGAAKESHEPDVIAATMAKPGVVLKRPVGSDGAFGEHAELPKNLGQDGPKKSGQRRAACFSGTGARPPGACWYFACHHRRRERPRLPSEHQICVDQQLAAIAPPLTETIRTSSKKSTSPVLKYRSANWADVHVW
jgi:hypothetical protein